MLSAFVAKRHFYPKRVRLQTLGYLPERAWINLSMPRRSCETQAISPNNNPTGRTKTSCLICESGSDSGPPAAKNGRFLAVENGRDARSRTSKGTLAAYSLSTPKPMSAYQHEATKACTPYSSLSPGASRGTGHGRRDNGVVGVGTRDQTLAAAGPQVSGGLSKPRLPREAQHSRRTRLLSCKSVATDTAG